MQFTIRSNRPEDYPAVTRIYNAQNEPHHHRSEAELRRGDELAAARRFHHRLNALLDGDVVATGQFGERAGDDEPGKYWGWFFVREDFRGRGADTALFDAALDMLDGRNPRSMWTCIREDFVAGSVYLGERDFSEEFRSWGANLDLAGFDPGSFEHARRALIEEGIELRSYAELAGDVQRDEKLAQLQEELEEDAPHFEPIIPKRHPSPDDPDLLLESLVVATRGGEYLGMASLMRPKRFPDVPMCGLTGVRRQYRNRGVATALKAHTAAWAKERGYAEVNAGGAGANVPMLKVNRRLGYDVEPAWITYAKDLRRRG